jgi:hypothetical protein
MTRRLLAFALAVFVIGGPLAGDLCAAACAGHSGPIDSPARASHHHHPAEVVGQPSPHHHPDAAAAPASRDTGLMALPHAWCGHLEAIVSESREVTRPPIVEAAMTMGRITPLLVPVFQASGRKGGQRLPPIRSTSQLRI